MPNTKPAHVGRATPHHAPSDLDCRLTDIQTIVEEVANRVIPFLAETIVGDQAKASRATRVTVADLDSEQARRARCRYWVAVPYTRQLVAHQLNLRLYAHPGPFETDERLAQIAAFFTQLYGRRGRYS